jgi:hypothetical protein
MKRKENVSRCLASLYRYAMLRGILIHLTQYLPRYLGISSETVANGFPNAPETEDCSNCSVLTTRSHVGSNALIPLLASVLLLSGATSTRTFFFSCFGIMVLLS